MPDWLKPWIPDGWQGPKEVARIASNALALLALAQIAGADLARIGLDPPVPWWGTASLAALAWLVTMRIGYHQESKRAGTGPGSEPPGG